MVFFFYQHSQNDYILVDRIKALIITIAGKKIDSNF